MVPQVGEGLEGFAALWTHMWPFACVCSPVFSQVHALDETLSAHLTAEWPFARVRAQMLSQVRVLTEALAAHMARKGALAGVDSQVKCDAGRRHKQFPTDGTLVGFGSLP